MIISPYHEQIMSNIISNARQENQQVISAVGDPPLRASSGALQCWCDGRLPVRRDPAEALLARPSRQPSSPALATSLPSPAFRRLPSVASLPSPQPSVASLPRQPSSPVFLTSLSRHFSPVFVNDPPFSDGHGLPRSF